MYSKKINILLIEDNPGDYAFINHALQSGHLKYNLEWVKTLEAGIKLISKNAPDSILLDLGLPDSSGLSTLHKIVELESDSSIVVLTGNTDDELGLKAMKIGAHDYLIKGEFPPATLPRAIRYAAERKESEKILLNHQMILEKEVEKRTAKLIKTNKRLKEEIDMRREVEKNLKTSEENFRLISYSAKDAIVKMDQDGKVSFWNPAAERIFGYTANEIIGRDAHQFLATKHQQQKAKSGLLNFLKTGKGNLVGNTIEVIALHKNGQQLNVEISLSSIKSRDNSYQAVGIIRDITERKLAEQKIRENNLFLQTLLNTIPVPIFYKNARGVYQGGNQAFFNFIGQKHDEVIGKTVHELNSQKNFADGFSKMDHELFKNQKKQVYEWKVVNSLGESRDVVFHKAIYKNSQDEVLGIVGIFIDITESKIITSELRELKESLEEKVSERTEQLREANATKDKFFSIIAHDLKSPFNIIQGFLTLIHDEFEEFTKEELKTFIGKTLEASTNTFSLLENLLEWSRSQRGTIQFNPEVIQLGEICNEVIIQSTDYAKQKNIDISLDIAPNHQVFADPEMTMTILRNLVSNAVKFSNPGDPVNIISKETPEYMEICVKDYGIGMNEDLCKNLFNLNEKTQRTGTNKEKGTGLGLILCREFIEKNNGKLWVKSRENKGSSFYFSLPLPNSR